MLVSIPKNCVAASKRSAGSRLVLQHSRQLEKPTRFYIQPALFTNAQKMGLGLEA